MKKLIMLISVVVLVGCSDPAEIKYRVQHNEILDRYVVEGYYCNKIGGCRWETISRRKVIGYERDQNLSGVTSMGSVTPIYRELTREEAFAMRDERRAKELNRRKIKNAWKTK